jgi:hypothetical protein
VTFSTSFFIGKQELPWNMKIFSKQDLCLGFHRTGNIQSVFRLENWVERNWVNFEDLDHFQVLHVEDVDRLPKYSTRRWPPHAVVLRPIRSTGARASPLLARVPCRPPFGPLSACTRPRYHPVRSRPACAPAAVLTLRRRTVALAPPRRSACRRCSRRPARRVLPWGPCGCARLAPLDVRLPWSPPPRVGHRVPRSPPDNTSSIYDPCHQT